MISDLKLPLALSERTRNVAKVLWVTLGLNWIVAALKIVFGMMTQCMVIVADGVHSFSDGTSNIVGLVAITLSGHPADENHPYGHQKYETLASLGVAFFLFLVSFEVIRRAIEGLFHPKTPEVNAVSFGVMTGTLLVNLFVVWYERKKGKELKSDFLISDSWHTLTDIFVTLSVFVALIGIRCHVPRLDAIFSLVIAGAIIVTALNILKNSSDILCDKAVLETGKVERIVRSVKGVQDCHEIRTRGRMDNIYVDLHVLVDSHMSVLESHRLTHIIENRIRKEISGVRDIVVHIEPVSHEHDELDNST